LITYFLSNIFAKYYENPTMLSPVISKNTGDVFETHCRKSYMKYRPVIRGRMARIDSISDLVTSVTCCTHCTDRQTDRQTDKQTDKLHRVMRPSSTCSNVAETVKS